MTGECELVADRLLEGRVALFLGAGVNLCDRPGGLNWSIKQSRYLPTGGELAEYLAQRFHYHSKPFCVAAACPNPLPAADLARVSQYGDAALGMGDVYDTLRDIFSRRYPLTSAHRFLASLPCPSPTPVESLFQHPLIVTTNYDDLMERAFDEADPPLLYDLVFYDPLPRPRFWHKEPGKEAVEIPPGPGYAYEFFARHPVVLKIHGTIDRAHEDREGYLITEDDYMDYLAVRPLETLLPARLWRRFEESNRLFLGYSLRDWNFRAAFRYVQRNPKKRRVSWAVVHSVETAEEMFWDRNGVKFLQMPLGQFIPALKAAMIRAAGDGKA